jgi:integrase
MEEDYPKVWQIAKERFAMDKEEAVEYHHEAKICERGRTKGGRVFYIEFCQAGKRKYSRAHDGTCRCKSSTDRRPCQHLLQAQSVLLDYKCNGLPSARIDLSLKTLFGRYESDHSDGRIEASTLNLYSYGWKYLLEYTAETTGIIRASELTPKLMMSFKWWLRNTKDESDCYTAMLLRALRTIFNWAIRENYMATNPLSGANLPANQKIIPKKPVNERERNPLTVEEVRRIKNDNKAPDWVHDMALLFLHTGMRLGEMLNLPFSHVTSSCVRIDDVDEWHPKQHQKRDIPLHPVAREIIQRRRVESPNARFVFETSSKTRYIDSNVQKRFKTLFNRLTIAGEDGVGVTIHCFRHTFATEMFLVRTPATTVKDFLGHKDLATTMLYCHRIQSRNAEIMSLLTY